MTQLPPNKGREHLHYLVEPSDSGMRIDAALARLEGTPTRSRLKQLILSGALARQGPRGDETIVEPSRRVKPGERYILQIPPPTDPKPAAEAIALDVVYEDADLIVVDKPAGLVVHPAPGHATGTLVNALLYHCGDSLSGIGGERRPGIVHRLDKDTSGLMVAAKNDRAHTGLAEQFQAHSIHRAYSALVRGLPVPAAGVIDVPVGRDPDNRLRMAAEAPHGRPAKTRYKVAEVFRIAGKPVASLVEAELETGRTHQVRVHLAHLGYPVIGDPLYGRRWNPPKLLGEDLSGQIGNFRRQALHAAQLEFDHPVTGERLKFRSRPPNDMRELIGAFRGVADA